MNELASLKAYLKTKQNQLVNENLIVKKLLLTIDNDEQFQHLRAAQIRRNSTKEILKQIQNSIHEFEAFYSAYSVLLFSIPTLPELALSPNVVHSFACVSFGYPFFAFLYPGVVHSTWFTRYPCIITNGNEKHGTFDSIPFHFPFYSDFCIPIFILYLIVYVFLPEQKRSKFYKICFGIQ